MSSKNSIISKPPQIIKRLAKESDLDSLVKISKVNFEDRAIYQFNSLSKKYWKIALDTESAEIWVWEIKGEIAAIALMAIDLENWNKIKLRWTDFKPIMRYLSYLILPKALFIKLKKRIWIIRNLYHLKKISNTPLNNKSQLYRYGGIDCDVKNTLWNELVAVSPQFRQYGLALQVARFNDQRAIELGRNEIYGEIEAVNEKWWMLHERMGWERVYSKFGRFTYRKILL